ncbi:hypothetical protein ILYODFUR_017415 [Ilyodon furcidens]|uniref:Uncharacterized protein n=1 Tax=Ilyodon furcidens TaxID=33524 RepID=A0ABV0SXV8_9TELE
MANTNHRWKKRQVIKSGHLPTFLPILFYFSEDHFQLLPINIHSSENKTAHMFLFLSHSFNLKSLKTFKNRGSISLCFCYSTFPERTSLWMTVGHYCSDVTFFRPLLRKQTRGGEGNPGPRVADEQHSQKTPRALCK